MPKLIETCADIRNGLQRARVANQTKHEISALQERIKEWNQVKSARASLLSKIKVLGADFSGREDIASEDAQVKTLAAAAKKVLENGTSVQALSDDNLWVRLITLAKNSNERYRSVAKEEWRSLVDSLGHIEAPSALEARMLNTPDNQALLNAYKQHFEKVQTVLRAELPASETDKTTLLSSVKSIQDLSVQLKSFAPEAVRVFLQTVQTGGASLAMATTEVLEWIQTHDDLNRFVVKPKGMSTWR
jgi:hypothetical protein